MTITDHWATEAARIALLPPGTPVALYAGDYNTGMAGRVGCEQPNYEPAPVGFRFSRPTTSWGATHAFVCVLLPGGGTRWEKES